MNDERNAQIVDLWNKGLTISDIAKCLCVSNTLVSSLIIRRRALGEITRPKFTKWTNDERNAKIVKLWNIGYSAREVSEQVGCTKNVVIAAVVKHRNLGDITRPMVESLSERGKMAMLARYGVKRRRTK